MSALYPSILLKTDLKIILDQFRSR